MTQTYTIVNGEAYRGSFYRRRMQHANLSFYVESYLSANVNDKWISVRFYSDDEDTAPSVDVLRDKLASEINKFALAYGKEG